jgi:hypothetical protein
MDLERGASQLRPRGAYEAVDFGFRLVKPHYLQILATTVLAVGPLALLLGIAFRDHLGWLSLAVWWLKPVWERTILFMLSRALFGDRPGIRETLRSFPRYGLRDLVPTLSYRRLSPTRSFDLPVAVLEGATGRVRADRLGMLHRGRFPSASVALLFVLVNVEGALFVAMIVLALVLTPEIVDWNVVEWAVGDGDPEAAERGHFSVIAYFGGLLAALLVAPFYVGAGFSLYLHRRTELEAWDLELAFRRLVERIRSRHPPAANRVGAAVGLLVALLGLGSFGVDAARAEDAGRGAVEAMLGDRPEEAAESRIAPALGEAAPGSLESASVRAIGPEEARETIDRILAGEAFHQTDTIELPRFLLDWRLGDDDADEDREAPAWLVGLAEWVSVVVGGGLEVVLVATGLALLVAIVFWLLRQRGIPAGVEILPRRRPEPPTELFGLEVTSESLPADLAAEARARAQAGQARAALALLYRGALSRLAFVHGAVLARGVTEGECLEIARPLLPRAGLDYFRGLTHAWLRCAYGHIEPEREGLLRLCEGWSRVFEVQASPPAATRGGARNVG